MTKKHFIALADSIRGTKLETNSPFDKVQLDRLADFCASQNPRFNRKRWLAYINGDCGPNGGKR